MGAKKGNKNAVGNKGGRPTDYKPEYAEAIIEFFKREPTKLIYEEYILKDDIIKKKPIQVPNDIPFFGEFARSIDVSQKTLTRWAEDEENKIEFCHAYKKAKELQKEFLIKNGLSGLYSTAFAIFTAKNITDMRDEKIHKTDITTKGEKITEKQLSDKELTAIADVLDKTQNESS